MSIVAEGSETSYKCVRMNTYKIRLTYDHLSTHSFKYKFTKFIHQTFLPPFNNMEVKAKGIHHGQQLDVN